MADVCVLHFAPRLFVEDELAQQAAGAGLGGVANLNGRMLSKLAEPVLDHDPVLVEMTLGSASTVQGLHKQLQELEFVALEAPGSVQVGPNLSWPGARGPPGPAECAY